jgi:hypothetical protein
MGIFSRLFQRGQEPGGDRPNESAASSDLADAAAPSASPIEVAPTNGTSHLHETTNVVAVKPARPVVDHRVEAKETTAVSTPVPDPVSQAAPAESSQRASDRAGPPSPAPRLAGSVQLASRLAPQPATVASARRAATPPTGAPITPAVRPAVSRPTEPAAATAAPRTQAPVRPAATARPAPAAPVSTSARMTASPSPAPPLPSSTSDEVFDQLSDALESLAAQGDRGAAPATPYEVRSTPGDLAAARRVFEDLAVGHVAQVRDVMLELQLGDVACSWVESSKPALRSLRAMAEQMDLDDLCHALDDFCTAVDAVVTAGGTQIGEPGKDELMRRYRRLIELIPKAFELDGERDRREPIIVESLLRQVDGVEALTIDKLRAVGLGRLDALLAANPEDMAATSGIRHEIAVAITQRLHAYRDSAAATVAAPDVGSAQREIKTLLGALRHHHDEFERAAAGWSDDSRTHKRVLRKERDQTYLRIKVTLARLGERDRITRLDKVPFQERIADLERFVALASSNQGG